MKTIDALALLCLLLLAPSIPLFAQSTDSTRYHRDPAFWDRFEREVDKFISNALDGFSNAEEPSSRVVMDTAHTWAQPTKRSPDYGRSDKRQSQKFIHSGTPRYVPWIGESTIQDHLILRYNWKDGKAFTSSGMIGHGLGSHR
jgi:hypothetical protein